MFNSLFGDQYIRGLERGLHLPWHEISNAIDAIKTCNGVVWLAGNGGSASLASHMAVDLQLAGIRAQALCDAAAITSYGNDDGFEYAIAEQAKVLIKPEDLLILISTSGMSENLCKLKRTVSGKPGVWPYGMCKTITITAKGGGELAQLGDINIILESNHTGIAQDLQQIVLHIICYWLMVNERDEIT